MLKRGWCKEEVRKETYKLELQKAKEASWPNALKDKEKCLAREEFSARSQSTAGKPKSLRTSANTLSMSQFKQ